MGEREAWLWLAKLWREGGGTVTGRVGICVLLAEYVVLGDLSLDMANTMLGRIKEHAPKPKNLASDLCWPPYDWLSRAEFCERMAEVCK